MVATLEGDWTYTLGRVWAVWRRSGEEEVVVKVVGQPKSDPRWDPTSPTPRPHRPPALPASQPVMSSSPLVSPTLSTSSHPYRHRARSISLPAGSVPMPSLELDPERAFVSSSSVLGGAHFESFSKLEVILVSRESSSL